MPHLNRRQTLGLLAASAALPLLGGYPLRAFAAGNGYLALVEKEAPGIGFYRLADGKRVAVWNCRSNPMRSSPTARVAMPMSASMASRAGRRLARAATRSV